jgi:hypothetical protein
MQEFFLNMYKWSDPRLDGNWFRNGEMFKMSQFEPIFGKKLIVLKQFFQTPLFFFDTDCSSFKTYYKDFALTWLKDI